jgi:hypothetical protein
MPSPKRSWTLPFIELCLEVQGELDQSLEFIGIQRIAIAA